MNFSKLLRFTLLGSIICLSVPSVSAAKKCEVPQDCPSGVNCGGAADPVFFFMDNAPAVTLIYRQSEIQMGRAIHEARKAFRVDESQLLSTYEGVIRSEKAQAYSEALKLWAEDVSADLKRYVLLLGIGSVADTEQKNDLRFLLASLNDTASSKAELNRMAMSNGLERRKAARLLTLMMSNPTMQVAQE